MTPATPSTHASRWRPLHWLPAALASLAIALAICASSACTTPIIVETADGACRNGLDDDGNGKTDCEDPACAESGACETTLARCRNELDEDRNGKTDCEDPACAKFCAAFDIECDTVSANRNGTFPRPDDVSAGSGQVFSSRRIGSAQCPVGMFCYAKSGKFTGGMCSLPGPKRIGANCTNAGECEGESGCPGVCSPVCRNDAGCPQSTYCGHREGETGYCSTPCIPELGNSGCAGYTCLTLHQFQIRYRASLSLAVCSNAPSWAGTATTGMPCANPPSRDKLGEMCAPTLVCIPTSTGAAIGVCRPTCAFDSLRNVLLSCAGGATCTLAFPEDTREPLENAFVPGICLP
jgi:hypothetical protein